VVRLKVAKKTIIGVTGMPGAGKNVIREIADELSKDTLFHTRRIVKRSPSGSAQWLCFPHHVSRKIRAYLFARVKLEMRQHHPSPDMPG